MRLTIHVSGMGDNSMTRFPALPCPIADLCKPDGKLDLPKCSAALGRDAGLITQSSRDTRAVYAFTLEFLRQLESVARSMSADPKRDCRAAAETKADKILERRLDKGAVCYVRLDIAERAADLSVRIGVANPRETVGTAPARARDIAVLCARIVQEIARQFAANPRTIPVALGTLPGGEGIWQLARAVEQYDRLAAKRAKCPNLQHGGYCSPSVFACPLYADGKCQPPNNPLE